MNDSQEIHETIVALAEEALARWINGDPFGFIDIASEDFSYFNPFLEHRLDSQEELRGILRKNGRGSSKRFSEILPTTRSDFRRHRGSLLSVPRLEQG